MYVERLLREGLELPATFELRVERAHRALMPSPQRSKAVLKDKKIRFQMPFPARFRVFYQERVVLYGSAEEETEDMVKRGFPVSVIKHPDSLLERIQRFTWHTVKKPGNQHRACRALDCKENLQAFRHQESGWLLVIWKLLCASLLGI